MFKFKFNNKYKFKGIFLILMIIAMGVQAQNFSGLKGKELSRSGKKMFEGETPDQQLTVKVTDDTEQRLEVEVKLTGFEGERYVKGVLTTIIGLKISYITMPEPVLITSGSPKKLAFEMQVEKWLEGREYAAPELRLFISESGDFDKDFFAKYRLGKKFFKPVNPENMVINVRPAPIGSAASLPSTPPAPNKVVVPQRKTYEVFKANKTINPRLMHISTLPVKTTVKQPVKSNSSKNTTMVMTKPMTVYKGNVPVKKNTNTKSNSSSNPRVKMVQMQPKYTAVILNSNTKGLSKEEKQKGAQGPSDNPISLWEGLASDVDFEFPHEITNIRLDIYPDKNPESGVFYYLPAAYHIRFDEDKGHEFIIDYGTSSETEETGEVRMSGTLSPAIGLKEVEFVKALIEAYQKRNPGMKFTELRAVPTESSLEVNFSDELSMYNIDQVSVNVASTIAAPLEVSWKTNRQTADDIVNSLKSNVGVRGKMIIKPQGSKMPDQEVPVRITLADERTLGRFDLDSKTWRHKKWRNITPYPVKLRYMHLLAIEKVNGKTIPLIYSWDLNNQEIPSLAQVQFDGTSVPVWLDTYKKAERVWLDYTVVDCDPCEAEVLQEVVHATSRPSLQKIEFNVLEFFEEMEVEYIDVEVRSIQGDPQGNSLTTLPVIHIDGDAQKFYSTDLFIKEGDNPQFEYRLTLVLKNGRELISDQWMEKSSLRVPLGSYQISEIFPDLE